ncbi:hypothetical protein [Pseudanabaena sp. Chao 1811]|uniref:hypothetical protein n=1 Tax=Pseudanabaena sp. Chao 1811 TaxID=2963092 RepID=UPI0022F395C6|nr:hypothetical protein [Pseudanabaena sp. Chao 1811]
MMWRNRRTGFVRDEGRSLFDVVGNGRSGLWGVRVRSLFDVGKWRSGFGEERRSLFDG